MLLKGLAKGSKTGFRLTPCPLTTIALRETNTGEYRDRLRSRTKPMCEFYEQYH